MLLAAFNLLLTFSAFSWVIKLVGSLFLLMGASASFYMGQYGAVIDVNMLRNVFETDPAEVIDLLSLKMIFFVLFLGVLPCVLLWITPINYRRFSQELIRKIIIIVLSAIILIIAAVSNYQGMSSLFRNHPELRDMVIPSNIVNASWHYFSDFFASAAEPFHVIGSDAIRSEQWKQHKRKSLTVIVVGESARAKNMYLLGYKRQTNPQLSKAHNLIGFSQVHSCGTETAVSLPCMFSKQTRKQYKPSISNNQSNLLDLIQRAKIDVAWRDNQSGCKGVCSRVKSVEDVRHSDDDPVICPGGRCFDEELLKGLKSRLDNLQHDTVLVLHQMGSHGPAYYKRYPNSAKKFKPICKSNALNECATTEVINSYDNTIVYTDAVLAKLIHILQKNAHSVDTAMIYLSDHGESLGEYNLFLHGTPYVIAPDEQKHIPLLMWFSKSYQQDFSINMQCIAKKKDQPYSQDHLFHSVLSLLQIKTKEYNSALDIFKGCKK
ncbi:UNVERIFIED_CONTAM: hypothetical protein GTU68_041412 [Idotea baltica]|nr:hypothetical protein [Idotea baltica]